VYLKSLLASSPSTKYLSASAFAPIANPTQCPWGDKAFKGYLAGGLDEGKQYDATELLGQLKGKEGVELKVRVDVGTGDQFYQQKQRASSVLLLLPAPSPHPTHARASTLTPSLLSLLAPRRLAASHAAVLPENLIAARDAAGFSSSQLAVHLHERYDHSYYFISTFAPGAPSPSLSLSFFLRARGADERPRSAHQVPRRGAQGGQVTRAGTAVRATTSVERGRVQSMSSGSCARRERERGSRERRGTVRARLALLFPRSRSSRSFRDGSAR